MTAYTVSLAVVAASMLALAPLEAQAQTYRCVGRDGKKYYGQTIPRACIGRTIEQLNVQGTVIKRIEPPPTAEEVAAKEAAEQKKRDEAAAAKEEARRNRALLATYRTVNSIDEARARALSNLQRTLKETEGRIANLKKRQADLAKELEFYQGKNKPPAKLQEDIKNVQVDIEANEKLLAVKQKEAVTINAKYDEDKKRYVELSKNK